MTTLRGAAAFLRARRGTIAVVLLLVLFAVLTAFATSPGLRREDVEASRLLQRADTPVLTALAEGFTYLGSGAGLVIVGLPVLFLLARARKPVAAWLFAATVPGHLLNVLIKSVINRPRPGDLDLVLVLLPAGGSSFPSGHAQAATMYFGFLAVLIGIHVRSERLRHGGIGVCVLIGAAICVSRVYLGAHFVSDVVGGVAVGLLFLWAWVQFYRRFGAQEFAPTLLNSTAGDL